MQCPFCYSELRSEKQTVCHACGAVKRKAQLSGWWLLVLPAFFVAGIVISANTGAHGSDALGLVGTLSIVAWVAAMVLRYKTMRPSWWR